MSASGHPISLTGWLVWTNNSPNMWIMPGGGMLELWHKSLQQLLKDNATGPAAEDSSQYESSKEVQTMELELAGLWSGGYERQESFAGFVDSPMHSREQNFWKKKMQVVLNTHAPLFDMKTCPSCLGHQVASENRMRDGQSNFTVAHGLSDDSIDSEIACFKINRMPIN